MKTKRLAIILVTALVLQCMTPVRAFAQVGGGTPEELNSTVTESDTATESVEGSGDETGSEQETGASTGSATANEGSATADEDSATDETPHQSPAETASPQGEAQEDEAAPELDEGADEDETSPESVEGADDETDSEQGAGASTGSATGEDGSATADDTDPEPVEGPDDNLLLADDIRIMYGERGDNLDGNLDALLLRDLELADRYDITYTFYIADPEATPELVDGPAGHTLTTTPVRLEELPAGTSVTVVVEAVDRTPVEDPEHVEGFADETDTEHDAGASTGSATADDGSATADDGSATADDGSAIEDDAAVPELVEGPADSVDDTVISESATFTIEKRAVRIYFEQTEDAVISEKDAPEDGLFVPDEEIVTEHLIIEVLDVDEAPVDETSFALMEDIVLTAEVAIDGEIALDVSEVDTEELGFHEVPMDVVMTEQFEDNYLIVSPTLGFIYVDKAHYYATFTAYNNGDSRRYSVEIASSQTIKTLLTANNLYATVVTNGMDELVRRTEENWIAGWRYSSDNKKEYFNDEYTTLTPAEFDNYVLQAKTDYYFTAIVRSKIASNLYIEAIPSVYYDGRAHVSYNAKVKGSAAKTKAGDLEIRLIYIDDEADFFDPDDGGTFELREGTDYTVTYKNNKNASMRLHMDENGDYDGTYEPAYTDDSKRPYAVIKGKGIYAGFTATAYFEILPRSIGRGEQAGSGTLYGYAYAATVSGIKNVYALNSQNRMRTKVSPKVTKQFYYSDSNNKYFNSKLTLKKGTDYTPVLYRYNDISKCWDEMADPDPNHITQEGRYLYTVWGAGNYCGIAYGGQYETLDFCDGKSGTINPAVAVYDGNVTIPGAQFLVAKDTYMDLSKAKITIGKSKISYDGKDHTADDFRIKVTIGSGKDKRTLTEGKDYYLVFDGVNYKRINEYNNDIYYHITDTAVYDGEDEDDYKARIKISNRYTVSIRAVDGSGYFGGKKGGSVRIKGMRLSASGWKYQKTYEYSPYNIKPTISVNVKSANAKKLREVEGKQATYSSYDYAWISTYTINEGLPGKYEHIIWAVGDGIDKDYQPKVNFTIKPISLSKAIKKGYVSFEFGETQYNAAGAYPDSGRAVIHGNTYQLNDMKDNNEKRTLSYSRNGRYANLYITMTASNNKKCGSDAYIKVSASGLFTGSATVNRYGNRFNYTINPIDVSGTIQAPVYKQEYGVTTKYVDGYRMYEGQILATVSTGQKSKNGVITPKATVYQTYYKNAADRSSRRLSLIKIPASVYKVVNGGTIGTNACRVKIENTRTTNIVNGVNFNNVYAADNYTVYDGKATIVSATVRYSGIDYTFPQDAATPIPFEGRQVRFDRKAGEGVTSITLKDGTVLGPDSFTVTYGTNIAAKKNGASFTITLKRDGTTGDYKYGGSKTFKFTIGSAAPNVL